MTSSDTRTELDELMADQALGLLELSDYERLLELLADHPEVDPGEMEHTAAALALALVPDEPMPETTRRRLQQRLTAGVEPTEAVDPAPAEVATGMSRGWMGRLGWYAAAASLVIAVVGWWPREAGHVSPAQPSLASVEEAPDAIELEWQPTDDPAADGAGGRLVWSDRRQQGYMSFLGLAPNDPAESQYQLWIFDAEREDYPVDGGVFNIPEDAEGEVIVPIRAKLPVFDPSLFAVTVERPGGVVVSDRSRITVVAEPPGE